jgi:hypothetical protein
MRVAVHYDFFYLDTVLSSFRCTPGSTTMAMHCSGADLSVFYRITRSILDDPDAMNLFTPESLKKLGRDAMFFCDCRVFFLNLMAAVLARKPGIMAAALKLMWREDKNLFNWLRLPWFALRETCRSFMPEPTPIPKEP